MRCLTLVGSNTDCGYGKYDVLRCSCPPSTAMIWPVMNAAASLRRKTVAFATSLTCPTRPSGSIPNSLSFMDSDGESFGLSRSMPAVSLTGPGAMTFERTPCGPSSTASTAEMESTAAFAALTWTW